MHLKKKNFYDVFESKLKCLRDFIRPKIVNLLFQFFNSFKCLTASLHEFKVNGQIGIGMMIKYLITNKKVY